MMPPTKSDKRMSLRTKKIRIVSLNMVPPQRSFQVSQLGRLFHICIPEKTLEHFQVWVLSLGDDNTVMRASYYFQIKGMTVVIII
jgi:hypothetical protein